MNKLADIICREIAADGAISFARFMELALYCPQLGYYEQKKDTVGRHGDFYTSVSVGPLFGQMLAWQFAEWLEEEVQSPKSKVQIAEAGAHDGKLAADILGWLRDRRPALFERLEYLILEPSPVRREWQRETLASFAPRVRWLSELPDRSKPETRNPKPFSGIFFGNELLDAFPVHRLGWDAPAKKWFEWGVTTAGDKFVWTRLEQLEISDFRFPISDFEKLAEILPDGHVIEVSPGAEAWWRQAAHSLAAGRLMAFDYGFTAEAGFLPSRPNGTLRAFHRHRVSDDLLAHVGEQDLTAHVNFTAIRRAGEAAGLTTDGLVSQSKFLTDIAARIWKNPAAFGEWTPAHTRQFQTLTHPQHLGRAFQVLMQSR